MKLRAAACFLVFSFAISIPALYAQQPAPAPPPQTARQALLEIITGGQQAAIRHLTIEMQKSLRAKGNKSFTQDLAVFDQMKAGAAAVQTFDTGQVLLSFSEPGSHEKLEVHVDSDDLSGDNDNLELSFHQFRDGVEEDLPYSTLLSSFTVGLKRQENIWRLNEVAIGIKVPLGDPALLEKISKNMDRGGMVGGKIAVGGDDKPETRQMSVSQSVMMLGFAESTFAQSHPDAGFTCSFADLAEANAFSVDERILKGEPYNGYKFTLSGCQGKPAETFHLVAEPLVPAAGAKAYCTNATRTVRTSDDGRGATCLASGKTNSSANNHDDNMGWDAVTLHTTQSPISK